MMNLVRNLHLAAVSATLCACASGIATREIPYTQKDLPSNHEIEIRLTNQSRQPLCVASWPNSAGTIADADQKAFLVIGSERYPMKPFDAGYCPGCKDKKVEPGEELVGRIRYDAFGFPNALYSEPKRLDFHVIAYSCPPN
jgi:hypothetical protein